MFRQDPDRYDDLVNPLKPWRSAGLVFLLTWVVVLADVLDLPFIGSRGQRDGFDPIILAFPFVAVVVYLIFWTVWRGGAARQRRRSRDLRERLQDRAPSGD
jgi:hypothetical protein